MALRHALQAIATRQPQLLRSPAFQFSLLMAPDERVDALSDDKLLGKVFRLARRVAIYHNGGDLACKAGEVFGNKKSMGLWGLTVTSKLPGAPTLTTVDCSDVGNTVGDNNETHWGHQYYRCSPRVLEDVRQVLAGEPCIDGRLKSPVTPPNDKRAWKVTFDGSTGPGCYDRKRMGKAKRTEPELIS